MQHDVEQLQAGFQRPVETTILLERLRDEQGLRGRLQRSDVHRGAEDADGAAFAITHQHDPAEYEMLVPNNTLGVLVVDIRAARERHEQADGPPARSESMEKHATSP